MELKTLFLTVFVSLPVCQASADSPTLNGHYYLQGAMEMAAELLLRDNGTFAAGIAYGSADGIAKGTWHVENKTLTLKSEGAPANDHDLAGVFQGLQLVIEPNCLAVDFGNGKACFRRR